jgi:hypothetical protein
MVLSIRRWLDPVKPVPVAANGMDLAAAAAALST